MELKFDAKKYAFQFKNDKQAGKLLFQTEADICDEYIAKVRDDFVLVGKDWYHFNDQLLWTRLTEEQYYSFVGDFFNFSYKNLLKVATKSATMQECMKDKMKEKMKLFCNQTKFITDTIKRSSGKLQNNDILGKFDSNIYMLPIKNNQIINLKTLEVRDRKKEDYCTYFSDVEYLEKTPNADKFFAQVQTEPEEREAFRRILGYSLTGDTSEQVFFVFYGNGRNGKGAVSTLMSEILKKKYTSCDKSIFMKMSKSAGQASPELVALDGARVACYSEGQTADEIALNESLIKQVTGEDKISGRALYGQTKDFLLQCKLWLLTNYIPRLDGQQAMLLRTCIVYFDSQFKKDPSKKIGCREFKIDSNILDTLKTKYLSEVFSWIARGTKDYYEKGSLDIPASWEKRKTDQIAQTDSVQSFLDNKVKITLDYKEDRVGKRELLEDHYFLYCSNNRLTAVLGTTFYSRLEQLGVIFKKSSIMYCRGIRLLTKEEERQLDSEDEDEGKSCKSTIEILSKCKQPETKITTKTFFKNKSIVESESESDSDSDDDLIRKKLCKKKPKKK